MFVNYYNNIVSNLEAQAFQKYMGTHVAEL